MSAGVVQLQAKGAQDAWFTATDSGSFFNQVWKKHTNFNKSVEKHFIEGTPRNGGLSTINFRKTATWSDTCSLSISSRRRSPIGNS